MKTPTVLKTTIDPKQAGDNVRERRIAAGVRQNVLAEKLGISPGYMSDLEAGKRDWTQEFYKQALAAIVALKLAAK